MDDWIQVFKTGKHVDASGDEREWDEEDLDWIVSTYNPAIHEAPVVIGHPEANAPAFGWVEALKREGNILFAKLKDLLPVFVDMVRQGLYKKRSIALYPDRTLRHIGFLGAMPPAIKGLEDVRFREGVTVAFSFSDFGETNTCKEVTEMSISREFDPGKELERKIKEVLRNPPTQDNHGHRFSSSNPMTYAEAFTYVQENDPELARQYAESLFPKRRRNEEKALNAGKKLIALIEKKMERNKGLSYSEAFTEVQKENVELVLEYRENL